MALVKRKVRHGVLRYITEAGLREIASRNDVIELDAEQAARFDKLNATVAVKDELERPGQMIALPVSPSDEEIITWVIGATASEVEAQIRLRPELGERLRGARERIIDLSKSKLDDAIATAEAAEAALAKEREEAERLAAAGTTPTAPLGSRPGEATAPPTIPPLSRPVTPVSSATGDGPTSDTPGQDAAPDFDAVVGGNVEEVKAYVADNPQFAAQVLDAENRRVAAAHAAGKTTEEPRQGVVRAVQAAAGHVGQ